MSGENRQSMVPLNVKNYPTWKVQCKMALMKDGLWAIANGTEIAPAAAVAGNDDGRLNKFQVKSDRALAIIVLSIDPSLIYLLGDPTNPAVVWKLLQDQFQKKSWANKLSLRKKLYGMRLKEKQPVKQHIKCMMEIFEELAIVGDPIEEEDRVVHLLASLPETYDVLVTALETNAEVPKLDVVTERLLHEERKFKDRESDYEPAVSKALATDGGRNHKNGVQYNVSNAKNLGI